MTKFRLTIASVLATFSLGIFTSWIGNELIFSKKTPVEKKIGTYSVEDKSGNNTLAIENKVAQPANPSINSPSTTSITETVKALSNIKVESYDTNFPSQAKALFTTLKHQLRDLITSKLNSDTSKIQNPSIVQAAVISELEQEGIKIGNPWLDNKATLDDRYYTYGSIYEIRVEQPKNHPELIVVTTSLGVCCGEDTSFYLFRKQGSKWQITLEQEAKDYDYVDGAHGSFSYGISPSNKEKDFFVVTANINPWCTSNWQSIRYTVMREGAWSSHPEIILNASETIYLGVDDPVYKLDVKSDSFSLKFTGFSSSEEKYDGIICRPHTVKFRIKGMQALRIP